MSGDRSWMRRQVLNHILNPEFVEGVNEFLQFVFANEQFVYEGKIKCPCNRCKLLKFGTKEEVKYHLFSKGFTLEYTRWDQHGEMSQNHRVNRNVMYERAGPSNPWRDFVTGGITYIIFLIVSMQNTYKKLKADAAVRGGGEGEVGSSSQPPGQVVDLDMWLETVGKPKKGLIHGLGNFINAKKAKKKYQSSSSSCHVDSGASVRGGPDLTSSVPDACMEEMVQRHIGGLREELMAAMSVQLATIQDMLATHMRGSYPAASHNTPNATTHFDPGDGPPHQVTHPAAPPAQFGQPTPSRRRAYHDPLSPYPDVHMYRSQHDDDEEEEEEEEEEEDDD
ncbi:Transpos_assoc domain-containing protein [Cephalotus follicularis]|uniref:Transpos_assoc domain-containing protein n=1 Tax=Cephalotus follicularis TaxID=3775 RepID=A0A1Q3C3U9_CEPFO|nr:Transpos_assoc domain-containing protein [Cephalotus follicularis]